MISMWWTMHQPMVVSKSYRNSSFMKQNDGLIKFILNDENKGFAHANNVALKQTS